MRIITLIVAYVVFVLSFFLPAVEHSGLELIRGWAAAEWSLHVVIGTLKEAYDGKLRLFPWMTDYWFFLIYFLMLMGNVLMLVMPFIIRWGNTKLRFAARLTNLAVVLAAIMPFLLPETCFGLRRSDLRVGYYAWVLSFALVLIATCLPKTKQTVLEVPRESM